MLKSLKTRYSALKNGKKGFTLIELVVVIAIMAILALIMVPNLTAYIQKGDDAKVKANMKNIHTAAELTIQSDSGISVKDIPFADRTGSYANSDAVKAEIAKFSNAADADLKFSADTTVADEDIYYISPKTDGRVLVSFKTDRVIYTFDGVAYTQVPVTP